MRRFEALKRFDTKSRNRLRAILGSPDANTIHTLAEFRKGLQGDQLNALDVVLNSSSPVKAVRQSSPFPKNPPFKDTFHIYRAKSLEELLAILERRAFEFRNRLNRIANSLNIIDKLYAENNIDLCVRTIADTIEKDGWSHAILRRIVMIRENKQKDSENESLDLLLQWAGPKSVVVSSLIHLFAVDQSYLSIKRSIMNILDRGLINRYSRALAKFVVKPVAMCQKELFFLLSEIENCSLIDAIILIKCNLHLINIEDTPEIYAIINRLGKEELFEDIVSSYDDSSSEGEYAFFKQSSTWLEYEPVRKYRILLDYFYDTNQEDLDRFPEKFLSVLQEWIGDINIDELIKKEKFTKHCYASLVRLELSGTSTRSAIFNYWLWSSEGQIGFERDTLLTLMGLTRDLSRTVPVNAARTAAFLTKDKFVKLILLLLLAKRSKNELDSFHLRKLLENITINEHEGSLVNLVRAYQTSHPYVSEYIYEIATEDFLAKLNGIAPHRSDIPEVRASLHEWMAQFSKDEHFLQRARTVRIDHQLNRIRNEIDDHRIYVDPSRFSSWIEDEVMIELNSALTVTGTSKKGVSVNCDETVLSYVMIQCYNAFCSNPIFGIASYIGRRIRHGTFHGHLYSSVINKAERSEKFTQLSRSSQFLYKWNIWKDKYNDKIEEIIRDKLHVNSKQKPQGLLQPESYGTHKAEVLNAAVKTISSFYTDSKSVVGLDQVIIDYCWRLAESDLLSITAYLKAQRESLKNLKFLETELIPSVSLNDSKTVEAFRRDLVLSIDRKLSAMFGWFKRPSIVAPQASLSLLFDAVVAEIRDTIPDFNPQEDENRDEDIELAGSAYHIVYDSLAVVVGNAAKHGDPNRPVRRKFEILLDKRKKLLVSISSFIRPFDDALSISAIIEERKKANFHDANLYQGRSGISKLMLLAHNRHDFYLEQYEVVGNEVKVRLVYELEH